MKSRNVIDKQNATLQEFSKVIGMEGRGEPAFIEKKIADGKRKMSAYRATQTAPVRVSYYDPTNRLNGLYGLSKADQSALLKDLRTLSKSKKK